MAGVMYPVVPTSILARLSGKRRIASRLAGRKSACTFDGSGLQSGERRSHKGSRLMLLAGRCWPRACWAIGLTAAAWRAGGGWSAGTRVLVRHFSEIRVSFGGSFFLILSFFFSKT